MLYWIEHQNSHKYYYAYKDISLLGYEQSICNQCNRPIVYPKFSGTEPHLFLEGSGEYPDYLQFCGAGRQMYIVSEKTLDLYEKNNISGYSDYRLVTVTTEIQDKTSTKIPIYYSLNITGRVDLDYSVMQLKKKKKCAQCGQFNWNRMRLNPLVIDFSTWDGSDLCLLSSFPGFKLCSSLAREVMTTNKLTGFSFRSG